MPRRLSLGVWLVVLIAAAACSARDGAPSTTETTSGALSCQQREQAARKYVDAALERHLTCSTAEQCSVIEVNTRCFDACSRAINADGVEDVKSAMKYADDNWCKTYVQDGCTRVIPPCTPPRAATCDQGKCGM